MGADDFPTSLEPMLATAAKRLPAAEDWGYEIKWDGVRAVLFCDGERARVCARRGDDASARYPELAPIAGELGRRAVFDGEVVAFDEEGHPSFGHLQRRMGLTDRIRIQRRLADTPVTYVAFDLLWLEGHGPLFDLPYERRRELLGELGFDGAHWQAPRHHVGDGEALLAATRERGLEGVVAKRLGSPYRPGRRSADWVKVQNRRRQELVVGGWMPGEGGRSSSVGSLLVGYWDATPEEAAALGRPQRLVYAGGVGTGFTQETLAELGELLAPLERPDSPFEAGWDPEVKYAARVRERGPLRWVEPELVAEIEFLRWTHEDTVRAASFKGVRTDKDPREVVREA